MSRTGVFGLLLIALLLNIVCQSVYGVGDGNDGEVSKFYDKMSEEVKGGMKDLKHHADNAVDSAEKTTNTWGSWLKDKMKAYGLISSARASPEASKAPAEAPENAYAPAY